MAPGRADATHITGPLRNPAGLILLAAVAAQAADAPDTLAVHLLGARVWVNGDGTELTDLTAGHACWPAKTVLRRLGALADDGHLHGAARPTADGVTFARAALRSWSQR